ncbi:Very-long-chain 3-oxoacyl-CoA reductase / 17beta-estradiol 17-dehydrogenase [Spironucleus salmonicida]|uniref:3-ketoacyl-CoA reductase n=1 Tax=Spironucleus salmonicida TaxID=348837 RepID=V6LCQ4_9EUKA|nr:Very-long-chain 3-oxoacyl-CoA reductase / 17beta-estradiol 17-dehydrogenase [Spironucleus salmonicida]|eukprot:EST42033.1 3-ketoacyl-CoA reductase [Spironucleus salmonicida]
MNRLKLALLIGVLIKPLRSFFFTFVRPPRNLKSLQKIRPIALVFGASSGIGNQFCYSLSKRNFHIIAVARREQNLQELQRQLGPKNCTIFPQDVTQASVLNVFETFDLSKLGIVVNCAGITQKLPSEINQIQSDEIDRIIGINVVAATRIYQRSCQVLTNNNGGIIINLASGVGICPCPLLSVYSASKAYCQALVEATRPELSKNGVLALSGTPFWVATEMTETTRTSFRMAGASQWVERFLAADWNGNHVNCWFSHQLFEFGIRVLGRFSGIVQLNQMEIIKKKLQKKNQRQTEAKKLQ